MNVGAKPDAGSSAWDQLANSPNHEHPTSRQPMPSSPVVKQPLPPTEGKPPEYGEELHPELVSKIVGVLSELKLSG